MGDAQGKHAGDLASAAVDESGSLPGVLVAHDYLTQRGGAERVTLSLLRAFPGAQLVTSTYDPDTTFAEFREYSVRTLWIDRVAFFRRDPRRAVALLARAFKTAKAPKADVVVCSSSGFAHGLRFTGPKVVYCHTPPRWLHAAADYAKEVPFWAKPAFVVLAPFLRRWDRAAAGTATTYLANSTAVQRRIEQAYGISSQVVYPPVLVDPDAPTEPVPGIEPGFLLTVSRKRAYKGVEAICEAVESVAGERLVVVGGLPSRPADPGRPGSERLRGVSGVSDAQLRWLYANCDALVSVSHEDFGLTPVEAYTFGKPSVLLRAGGFLDSSVEGLTTVFVDDEAPAAIADGIRRLRSQTFDAAAIRAHASGFDERSFHRAIQAAVTHAWREHGSAREGVPDLGPLAVTTRR